MVIAGTEVVLREDDELQWTMKHIIWILMACCLLCLPATGQEAERRDSLPHEIPNMLSPELFIPAARIKSMLPWEAAPMLRSVVHVLPVYGFDGSIGFGEFDIAHPDKFFSTLSGSNYINVPELYVSEQKMLGNTLKIGRRFYYMSSILYGAHMSVAANNWGMGTREGFIYEASKSLSVAFWTQYFQSVAVYSPVLFPRKDGDMSAIRMPATPEVFSFGVQATFTLGEFLVGVGASVAPVPFQNRHHSEFRYK